MELYGIDYLKSLLNNKRIRVLKRYQYYEMKNLVRDLGISTPPNLQLFQNTLGWCGKAVDSLADRLNVKGFKPDSDIFNFQEIFNMNNPDMLFDSAILSALVSSCCFIYISQDKDGYPRLQVIDGGNATGIIDPITGLLTEGYAVLKRNSNGEPIVEAYFIAGRTEIYYSDREPEIFTSKCPYPLLVPVIYRPDAMRQLGRSRISRACMDIQDSAIRTIKRSEISAEFYSFPQKYVTGLSEDVEVDKWKASMSSLLMFSKDDEGDHPILGQFATQPQGPHLEQLRMFASLFGGHTGLTLDDLGFASGNPSSSDAIKAAHEELRLTARKAQAHFGRCFLNVGMVAACLRDDVDYNRKELYKTEIKWYPVFEPDGASLAGTGDAMLKLQQAFPEYISEEKLSDLTGI